MENEKYFTGLEGLTETAKIKTVNLLSLIDTIVADHDYTERLERTTLVAHKSTVNTWTTVSNQLR